MSTDNTQIPAEELELETEASKEAKEEEVRQAVITEYGFDEVDDAEKISKLTTERIGSHKKLTTAIGQKIKYRDAAKGGGKTSTTNDDKGGKKGEEETPQPLTAEDIDKRTNAILEQRELDKMPYSKEIKDEIKRVAQIQGVSVEVAAKDPYIVKKIEDSKAADDAERASITNKKNKSGGKREFSTTPPDVDMGTEDGRKEWDEWKKWMAANGH